MANLSKSSNVVQEKYMLYDVTGNQKPENSTQNTGCMCYEQPKIRPEKTAKKSPGRPVETLT